MSAELDLDDVAAQSPKAQRELAELRAALRELLAVAPAKAPAAGLIVGIEARHAAAIKAARAALSSAPR